jgi:hypothetical protein
MMRPFIPSLIEDSDSADGQFAEVGWQAGLGADRAQETVPSVCYRW